jgi:hypothetical protein
MHTRSFTVDRSRTGDLTVTFHYESDLHSVHVVTTNKSGERRDVHVPGWVLMDFLAERVTAERIAHLEQHPREVMGIPHSWPTRWGNGS